MGREFVWVREGSDDEMVVFVFVRFGWEGGREC